MLNHLKHLQKKMQNSEGGPRGSSTDDNQSEEPTQMSPMAALQVLMFRINLLLLVVILMKNLKLNMESLEDALKQLVNHMSTENEYIELLKSTLIRW